MNIGEILIWESTNALLVIPVRGWTWPSLRHGHRRLRSRIKRRRHTQRHRCACWVKRLGSFQVLRDTFGSLLLSNGKDIAEVSRLLGHSDCAITLKIYSHFVPRKTGTMQELASRILSEMK